MEVGDAASRRALIIHGWKDDPSAGWLGWLGSELEGAGYSVRAPRLQVAEKPVLQTWLAALESAKVWLERGEQTLIIAHSLGCFLALRMLEMYDFVQPVSGLYLVSGFYDAPRPEASRWFSPEPNWPVIRSHASERVCIYSDNDTIVTPDRTRRLAHQLQARLLCIAGQGHFLGSQGMNRFPELLESLEERGFTA